jgi:hypothetical protein
VILYIYYFNLSSKNSENTWWDCDTENGGDLVIVCQWYRMILTSSCGKKQSDSFWPADSVIVHSSVSSN